MEAMDVQDDDIAALVDEIFMTTLGLPARQVSIDGAALAAGGPTLDGIVTITGDWQGAVVLQVPRPLAARIAAVMFRLGDAPPTLEDMQDAVGEITNMTGGNIKGLLPGACHLSLPAVVEGSDYRLRTPGAAVAREVVFDCDGQRAVVRMVSGAGGRRPA